MMEEMVNTYEEEDDVEDGELSQSSDEVYVPLQRPSTISVAAKATTSATSAECSPLATCHQLQRALEEDDQDSQLNSSSSSSGSEELESKISSPIRRKRFRRTVMVRVQPTTVETQEKRARFKKYSVWTAALQEDALTEDMRSFGVSLAQDRNVESYDFRRRLNGGDNCLKRCLSNSTDDLSADGLEMASAAKRGRRSNHGTNESTTHRRIVKSRLGHHKRQDSGTSRGQRCSSSPATGSDNSCSYDPRFILDLNEITGREASDIAREIANKLYEEKDDLLLRIVEVLDTELPIEIYKETQRIEAGGGMMIMNGKRRRTPGGVFLFLLKHHEKLTSEQHRAIFSEERRSANKWRKEMKSMSRDRKVEELKKRLSKQEKELPALSTRKDHILLGSDLSLENQVGNLSNPPPSPVGNENSPEYKPHALINHVISDASEPSTSASALAALSSSLASSSKEIDNYDDDLLDVNCGEMDFF